jgi:hypothetical protein
LAGAAFANPVQFTTEIQDKLTTDAKGNDVTTLSSGSYSSAMTSVATVHDYTLINAPTELKGDVQKVKTESRGYNSHACAAFGSVGVPTYCEPPRDH